MVKNGVLVPSELLAIGPIDGRYRGEVGKLADYFSEFALIKERVNVEIEYLIFVSKLVGKALDPEVAGRLRRVCVDFDVGEAEKVKCLEAKFDHDVKAIEVYLSDYAGEWAPLIHFGLTSEDVNNLAYGRLLKRFISEEYLPALRRVVLALAGIAQKYAGSPMLGRTHGQPASPTTFGKEMGLYAYRLAKLYRKIAETEISGKLNGAVGNLNALVAAYPQVDWVKATAEFIESLGLKPELFTTQILPYESYVEVFQKIALANSILINLARDIWMYYSYRYVSIATGGQKVGSSTMPHKVNPKDFENAEGNLKLANSLLYFYANELMLNRLQRDLTDSTLRRSFGYALGHTVLAYRRISKALRSLSFNEEWAKRELSDHAEVFSEALQTILRKQGLKEAYFKVLEKVRGKKHSLEEIMQIAASISPSTKVLEEFKNTIHENYLGLAPKLTQLMLKETMKMVGKAKLE